MALAKADRFRAYTKVEVQNRGADTPHLVEEVASEGETDGTASAKFNAGDTVISKIVFYAGPQETEVVVGCVDLNASGKVSAELQAEDA